MTSTSWQYPPRYKVSFRVSHPSLSAPEVARMLKMRPQWSWSVGQRIKTPAGTVMPGTRRNSYCLYRLSPPRGVAPADFLRQHAAKLLPVRRALSRLARTGGSTEYYVAVFSSGGDVFDAPLLAALGKLHVDLDLEAFMPSAPVSTPRKRTGVSRKARG